MEENISRRMRFDFAVVRTSLTSEAVEVAEEAAEAAEVEAAEAEEAESEASGMTEVLESVLNLSAVFISSSSKTSDGSGCPPGVSHLFFF